MIRTVKAFNLKNQRILMRVDFNVPFDNGHIVDEFRIHAALPTIRYCLDAGASIVLMSHLGRPGGKEKSEHSLIPIGEALAGMLEMPIKFSDDCISQDAIDTSIGLKPGEIHLLQNLRFHPGEVSNNPEYSEMLSRHGRVFINDAFATIHRAHASNVGVTKSFKNRGIGFLIEKEINQLERIIKKPKRPLVVILGGSKIGSKLKLIEQLLDKADTILLAGGMAFTFLSSSGSTIGGSLLEETMLSTANSVLNDARTRGIRLILPKDVYCGKSTVDSNPIGPMSINEIPNEMMGLDIGPRTIEVFTNALNDAETVFWNGPVGMYELPGYERGSKQLAILLAKMKEKGKTVIIGGGDTASAINKFGLSNEMSHISTGGGASLEILSGNLLPALQSLEI